MPEPAHDVVIETSKRDLPVRPRQVFDHRRPVNGSQFPFSTACYPSEAVSRPGFKTGKRSSSSASVRAASQPLFVHRYWPTGSAYSRDGACTALRMAFVMLRSDCGLPVNNWLINSVSCGGIRLNPVADSR